MNIPILYEDDTIIVINKPPHLVVNRAESVKGETVADWVDTKVSVSDTASEDAEMLEFRQRSGIVHRIDKETSGCLLIAKTIDAFTELQRQFKDREIKKTYLAIAHGAIVPDVGEIRAPVGRLPWNREHFGIVPGGKEAVTRYNVLGHQQSTIGKEALSVVEVYPETGRTHQIRVHLKYINHPIVGDYLYAGRKTARADRLWAPRVMLHAYQITFTHPTLGTALAIEAPIPDDMKKIIQH